MSAVIAGGAVEVEVALAVGVSALEGRWDDPAAQFDVTRWAQSDSTLGDWLDLTCLCSEFSLQMGGHEADPIVPLPVAGTCTLVMHGDTFDPWAGPWAGIIGEGALARVRARKPGTTAWSTAVAGSITHYAWDPLALVAEVEVTDALQLLNNDLPALDAPTGGGETATARHTRLLDRAEWSGGRDLTAGGVPMLPTTLDGASITSMRTVAESDMGWLAMTRAGTVAYRPAGFQTVLSPAGTITVCPVTPPVLPHAWSWSTGTGTITPTATGVIVTPDPRGSAANWTCRARSAPALPVGATFRATCRARLVSGTPDGILQMIVGTASQVPPTGRVVVTIPTDGSWVAVDGTAVVPVGATGDNAKGIVYMTTGGTAQVTVEVDQLVMYDTTGIAWDPTKPTYRAVTFQTRQDADLVNIAAISRQSDEGTEADTITVRDETSIARYGPRTYRRTDLQHQDVAQSQRIAATLVARGAWPSMPPAGVILDTAIDPAVALLLLTVDPLTRLELLDRQNTLTGLLVTGWDVTANYGQVNGELYVTPVQTVAGSVFDRAGWDRDRWEAA